MDKIVKARKTHKCDGCDKEIQPGEYYLYGEGKGPKYEHDPNVHTDNQIGIEYYKYHLCDACYDNQWVLDNVG